MRLFTAIDIPPDVKAVLSPLLDRLKVLADLRWIPAEKLHITTKFIGEWPEDRLDELKRALATVRAVPVDIVIRGLGWLPNPRNARVLYAGVDASDTLIKLAAATARAAAGAGATDDGRPYRPHVTLARTRKAVPLDDLGGDLGNVAVGSYRASSFALYLSAGGKYTKLQEFSLKS